MNRLDFPSFLNLILKDIFNRLPTINCSATINFVHPVDYTQYKINEKNKFLNYTLMFLDMLFLSTFIFHQEKLQKHLKRILNPRVLVNSIISVKNNPYQNHKAISCKNNFKSIQKKKSVIEPQIDLLCFKLNNSVKSLQGPLKQHTTRSVILLCQLQQRSIGQPSDCLPYIFWRDETP